MVDRVDELDKVALTKETYNNVSEGLSEYLKHPANWALIWPHVYGAIGDVKGKSVLELACGQGFQSIELFDRGAKTVVAQDLSETLIEVAKTNASHRDITFQVGDMFREDLAADIGGEQFDVIFSIWGIGYAQNEEMMKRCMDNIYKLLAPGGRALLYHEDLEIVGKSGIGTIIEVEYDPVGGKWYEGCLVNLTVMGGQMEVITQNWTYATLDKLMREVGFANVHKDVNYVDSEGLKGFGPDQWKLISDHKCMYLCCGENLKQ